MGFDIDFEFTKSCDDLVVKKRIVIGVLWMGEPQLKELIRTMIPLGNDYQVRVRLFCFQKNYDAHMRLWDFFINEKDAECRVKIDGDMVFSDVHYFLKILSGLKQESFYVVRLFDHITSTEINGVTLLTKNFLLDASGCCRMFPDKFPCDKTQIGLAGIDHCPSPSSRQIGEFIGHRFKKACKSSICQQKISYLRIVTRAMLVNGFSALFWGGHALRSFLSPNYKALKVDLLTVRAGCYNNGVADSKAIQAVIKTIFKEYKGDINVFTKGQ